MSGLWDKVKKSTLKTKLRGEIVLQEREITNRKKKFGIELYDLLTNDKNKLLGVASGTMLKGQQDELKDPFERAREEIAGMQARKDIKQKDLDVLEIKGASSLPDATLGQKVNKAGVAISNAGTGTKLRAEMALIDREMKIRKEQFGLEVFDVTKASEVAGAKGLAGAVSNAFSSMSQQEKEIQACIDKGKSDVHTIEGNIKSKQTEINMLDEEMEPLRPS